MPIVGLWFKNSGEAIEINGQSPPTVWILVNGTWNNAGVWKNSEVWSY